MSIFRTTLVIFLLQSSVCFGHDEKEFLLQLNGKWKFMIGDNKTWANSDFDDSGWESISVPSAWEDQGFFGYDGYAWYRNSFTFSRDMKGREIYISLGYINDVDQVFVNGHLIGFSGSFPPGYNPATDASRKYPIPVEYLNTTGKNIIAIRVYNYQMSGGIISGDVGIFSYNTPRPDISLLGLWLFRTGDSPLWKMADCKDKQWEKVVVPGNWENQGHKGYDGLAWYRKHFTITDDFVNQKIILIVGKIDNAAEVYINGALIGSTGRMPAPKDKKKKKEAEEVNQTPRVYEIPENLLSSKKKNIIAIRVSDLELRGGIIEGPLGLMKTSTFKRYQKEIEKMD